MTDVSKQMTEKAARFQHFYICSLSSVLCYLYYDTGYPKHTVAGKHEMESEIGGANLNKAITEFFKNLAVKFAGFHVCFDCFQGVQRAFGLAVWPFFVG